MPDIRQSATYLDTFQRGTEDPLVGPTGAEWLRSDTAVFPQPMVIDDRTPDDWASHKSNQVSGDMYWTPGDWDGDDAECWAYAIGGNAGGLSFALDLWVLSSCGGANTVDGYRFRMESVLASGPIRPVIYSFSNGSGSVLATGSDLPGGYGSGTFVMLVRRNGSDVEGWVSDLGFDTSIWTLAVTVSDSTYTTGLTAGIGCRDNSASGAQLIGFTSFGAGPLPDFLPQFIRRPWEYAGKHLQP
jgi:hypothetical protein